MSKDLQPLLALLQRSVVSRIELLELLSIGEISSKLELDSFITSLKESDYESIDDVTKEMLIKIVNISISNEEEDIKSKFNTKVFDSCYFHYQEVISSELPNDDQNIITEYDGKRKSSDIVFHAIYPKLKDCRFNVGGITVTVLPIDNIILSDGTEISYRYNINFSASERFTNEMSKVNREYVYSVLGLSGEEIHEFSDTGESYIIDTNNFFKRLIEQYNQYYSSLIDFRGISSDKFEGIESAFIDVNGVYMVPKLFAISYFNRDLLAPGGINFGSTKIQYQFNKLMDYKLSIAFSSHVNKSIVEKFMFHMKNLGISLNYKESAKSVNFTVKGIVTTSEEDEYQALVDPFYIDSRISYALKRMNQLNLIGYDNSLKRQRTDKSTGLKISIPPEPIGTERYTFIYSDNEMRPYRYIHGATIQTYTIYFNRTCYRDSERILNDVKEINKLKKDDFTRMTYELSQNSDYHDNSMNYIPSSIIKINSGGNSCISFLPFGFTRYDNSDILSNNESLMYSCEINIHKIKMHNFIKISKDETEIPNITQIIVTSNVEPIFTDIKPLRITNLDSIHYLCLFKSSEWKDDLILPEGVIFDYASDFIQQDHKVRIENETNNNILMVVDIEKNLPNSFNSASVVKYFIERMTFSSIFDDLIFTGDFSHLSDVCQFFIDRDINVDFFKKLKTASTIGTITCEIIDDIVTTDEVQNDIINSIKCFVDSIKGYIPKDNIKIFNESFHLELIKKSCEDINIAKRIIDNNGDTKDNRISRIILSMNKDKKDSSLIVLDDRTLTRESSDILKNELLIGEIDNNYGKLINVEMIKDLAGKYSEIMFNNFIRVIYESLSSVDFTREIMYRTNCNVNKVTNYRYNVVVNKSKIDDVKSLNNETDGNITFYVVEDKQTVHELGEYHYDPDIYCMFSLKYTTDPLLVLRKYISDNKLIYTNGITYSNVLLNDISFYNGSYENEGEMVQRFFLPFNNNGLKLMIKSVDEPKLETKTVMIKTDDKYSIFNSKILKRRLCYSSFLSFDSFNNGNRYFFTNDIKTEYRGEIYPVSQKICMIFARSFNSYKFLKVENINDQNKMERMNRDIDNLRDSYENDFNSLFEDDYLKIRSDENETLIINDGRSIYTKSFGKKNDRTSIDNLKYQRRHEIPTDIEQITTIDSIIIEESVIKQNEIIRANNMNFNLARAISSIKWDTKTINNYKFFNNSEIKAVKFSSNAYYMAVLFNNGAKIYIKSGDKYVYSSNLEHEGVSDIIFGNNMLCVTIQKQDIEVPYGILWITSIGFKINAVKLEYYKCVAGDVANIKYSTNIGKTCEVNNCLLREINGKLYYDQNKVEYSKPFFDHNVYFFSPNDKYFIYNHKGTFKVFNTSTMKDVVFTVKNNYESENVMSGVKTIKHGVWSDENTFNGITYIYNNKIVYNKIVLEFDKKFSTGMKNSINVKSLLTEMPTKIDKNDKLRNIECVNMTVEGKTIIHPLYDYLMSIKDKELSRSNYGLWLNNLYISISEIDDKIGLTFTTENNNLYFSLIEYKTNESLKDSLHSLIKLFRYTVDDNIITSISYKDVIIYGKPIESKYDDNIPIFHNHKYIFRDNSIYVWTNNNAITEMTHIDQNGYQKFIIEDYVSFYLSDKLNVFIINNDQLISRIIDVDSNVSFEKQGKDFSAVSVNYRKQLRTNYTVNIDKSFEKYGKLIDNGCVTKTEKIISSQMCLNRFEKNEIYENVEISGETTSHDSLLISVKDNEVTIIPKYIFKQGDIKYGFTKSWYDSIEDNSEFLINRVANIDEYLSKAYQIFKSLTGSYTNINFSFLKRQSELDRNLINKMLTTDPEDKINFIEGEKLRSYCNITLEQCIAIEFLLKVKIIKTYVFSLSGILSGFIDDNLKRYFDSLVQNPSKMSEENILDTVNEYDEVIKNICLIYGDRYNNFITEYAFIKLSSDQFVKKSGIEKISRYTHDKIIEQLKYETSIDETSNTILFNKKVAEIALFIVLIPQSNGDDFNLIKLYNFIGYSTLIGHLKNEIRRCITMNNETSQYEKYRTKEKHVIIQNIRENTKNKIALSSKGPKSNTRSDFINNLLSKPENIIDVPSFVLFDEDGIYENDIHRYVKFNDEVKRYDIEAYNILQFNEDYYDLIEGMIEKMKEIFDNNFDMDTLLICLNDKFIISDREKREKLKPLNTFYKELKIQMEDLIDKFTDMIKESLKNRVLFTSFDDLNEYLLEIHNITTKDYELTTEQVNKIIHTMNNKLDTRDEEYLHRFNLKNIDSELSYFKNCLTIAYYDSLNVYNRSKSVRDICYPILNKYRNGIESTSSKDAVVKVKLNFNRRVKHIQKSCVESDNIIFKYEIENDDMYIPHKRIHDSSEIDVKYGEISVNLLEIFAMYTNNIVIDADVDYNIDYSYSGIDFGIKKIEMGYNSKNYNKKEYYVDITNNQILSISPYKPLNGDYKIVRRADGYPALFNLNSSFYLLYYGNVNVKGEKHTIFVIQNTMTGITETYCYYLTKNYQDFKTNITNVSLIGDELIIDEIIPKIDYSDGKKITILVPVKFTVSFDNLIKSNISDERESTTNNYKYRRIVEIIENLDETRFNKETQILSTIIVKNLGNIIYLSEYKCGVHSGTIIEISGKYNSTINMKNFIVKSASLSENELLIVGTNVGFSIEKEGSKTESFDILKVGKIYIDKHISLLPKFINFFDHEINITNNCLTNISNILCSNFYVSYKSNGISYLVLINGDNITEVSYIADIKSITSSTMKEYIAVVLDDGKTDIWNVKGFLQETISGISFWM